MASTTAAVGPFRTLAATRPPLRQLWQVPTFLLGVIALAAVCAMHPPWRIHAASQRDPALIELRELLKNPHFDGDHALKLGAEAVHHADSPATRAEAHFLLGSTYVALAERSETPATRDQWHEARSHLEQAKSLGVTDDDRPKLEYRLAKTWAQTGEPADKVIDALSAAIDAGADDEAEAVRGYGLLAEAYLKLKTPDLEKALAATEKQISKPVVDDRLLGPAGLRRGELLFRLNRLEEAEHVLQNVGDKDKAPSKVVAQARRLRVRILEQQERWPDAAAVWNDVLADPKEPPQDRCAVLYHYGDCLRRSERKPDALQAWDDCLSLDGPREESAAAAIGVADLRLHEGQVEAALAALERAARDVKQPDDWNNSFVTLARARAVFEAGCKAASIGSALRLVDLYEHLAAAGRVHELRAEIASAAARATQQKASQTSGAEAERLARDAATWLHQTGDSYEKAADAQTDPAEQAERLWLAGNCFLDCHDAKRAAPAFDRFCKIAEQPEMMAHQHFNARLNEAHYKQGLAWRDLALPITPRKQSKQLDNATEAFAAAQISTVPKSRYVYRACYEAALLIKMFNGAWDDESQAPLERNLSQLRLSRVGEDRDEEAYEKTLYALGDLYFQRRVPNGTSSRTYETLTRAIDTLEEALGKFPNNPQALMAHYQLAESYRLRADQRIANILQQQLSTPLELEIQKQVTLDRERAISNYEELSRALDARPNRDEAQERLLVYALWEAADVRYWAGGYEKSAEMFEALIKRLKDKKGYEGDYFNAHINAVRGYLDAIQTLPNSDGNYTDKVRELQQKVRRLLPEIRASLANLDPMTRRPFEEWLKKFDRP